jgi:hypothetical protein
MGGHNAKAWIAHSMDCQHVRFALTGQTASHCVMHGLAPLWTPILHYDDGQRPSARSAYAGLPGHAPPPPAASGRLFLFYSETRKVLSPGGDLKLIISRDGGASWAPPVCLLAHEADGGAPKLCTGTLLETRSGVWLLPFSRAPHEPGRMAGDPRPAAPPDVPIDRGVPSAGVLLSRDRGASWRACGRVGCDEFASGTLSQIGSASMVELEPRAGRPLESRLLMRLVARFSDGSVRDVQASSTNGGETWSSAVAVAEAAADPVAAVT